MYTHECQLQNTTNDCQKINIEYIKLQKKTTCQMMKCSDSPGK